MNTRKLRNIIFEMCKFMSYVETVNIIFCRDLVKQLKELDAVKIELAIYQNA